MHYLTRMTTQTTADVDVIIPLYNNAAYIAKAVHSVIAQTRQVDRLMIVDDGSTDHGVRIVEEIIASHQGSPRILVIQQPNRGPNAARNRGLRLSSATYVAFLDSDDVWEPSKIQEQLTLFERAGHDLLMTYVLAYAMDQNDVRSLDPPFFLEHPLRGHIFEELLPVNLITGSASSVMIRRSALERTGMFDEDLRGFEDIDLWLRLSREGLVDVVEQPLVGLRKHPTNAQRDIRSMLREMLAFYDKWFHEAWNRPKVLHMWGHLIGEFVLRASDPREARRMVKSSTTVLQRRALFSRTFGSLDLYLILKGLRKLMHKATA